MDKGLKSDRPDVNYNILIGANMRYERMLRNLTLEELSYFLDMTPSTLGLIERGKRGTSIKNICNIADFFSISVDDLVKRDIVGLTETDNKTPREKKLHTVDMLLNNLNSNELDFITNVIKELVKFRKAENRYDI